jgi:hypothetical protein
MQMKTIVIALAWSFVFQIHAASSDEWTAVAPREEIRPQFQRTETGGKSGHATLVIHADEREGLHGWWITSRNWRRSINSTLSGNKGSRL